MKLTIHAEVEVDERAWEEVYGTGRRSIAVDVEDYILNLIDGSAAAAEGAITFTGYAVHGAGER